MKKLNLVVVSGLLLLTGCDQSSSEKTAGAINKGVELLDKAVDLVPKGSPCMDCGGSCKRKEYVDCPRCEGGKIDTGRENDWGEIIYEPCPDCDRGWITTVVTCSRCGGSGKEPGR